MEDSREPSSVDDHADECQVVLFTEGKGMPRPIKKGLDYFPLDVDLDQKMELIEGKYGIEGFGVVIKLWQRIYKNGYYVIVDENFLIIFKKSINVDIKLINEIIRDAVEWGIFDKKPYKKNKILTSVGIQKRYIEAVKRRDAVYLNRGIWLLCEKSSLDNMKVVWTKLNGEPEGEEKEAEVTRGEQIKRIIGHLNDVIGAKFHPGASPTKEALNGRLNDGYSEEDCIKVIDIKVADWKGTEFEKFIRPTTLFGTKFDSYLNQKPGNGKKSKTDIYREMYTEAGGVSGE